MAYVIHSATPDDLEDLNALVNSAYRGEVSRQGWTTEADFLEGQRVDLGMLEEQLRAGAILCLRDDDLLIGCVALQYGPGPDSSDAHLAMLTVRPGAQASGLGRLLLERGEAHAHRRGARRVILEVLQPRTSLMEWYERRGYRRTGRTRPFPYGDKRYGLPQRDDLHFVEFEKEI